MNCAAVRGGSSCKFDGELREWSEHLTPYLLPAILYFSPSCSIAMPSSLSAASM